MEQTHKTVYSWTCDISQPSKSDFGDWIRVVEEFTDIALTKCCSMSFDCISVHDYIQARSAIRTY